MIAARLGGKWLSLLASVLMLAGCGMAAAYRTADKETIRDFSGNGGYLKRVGVMALTNTSMFTSGQATTPFVEAFIASMAENASDAQFVIPGKSDVPAYLIDPPRMANGEMDVYALSSMARKDGYNLLTGPVIMDIRVRKYDTGFWIFKDVAYSLQIQTAAAIYDTVTGARLSIVTRNDEIEIDDQQAEAIDNGQEVMVDDLAEAMGDLGEELGEQMGEIIEDSPWLATVIAVDDGHCVIPAGSQSGIQVGDRLAVLDGSQTLTGLGEQRYIVPGPKIGELHILQVTPLQSSAAVESGDLPPVGSIVVPGS